MSHYYLLHKNFLYNYNWVQQFCLLHLSKWSKFHQCYYMLYILSCKLILTVILISHKIRIYCSHLNRTKLLSSLFFKINLKFKHFNIKDCVNRKLMVKLLKYFISLFPFLSFPPSLHKWQIHRKYFLLLCINKWWAY